MVGDFLIIKGGESLSGFIYKNLSTETILDERLILCAFQEVDSVAGSNKEGQYGEITITRPISNEYGTISQRLSFDYGLIKCSAELFTSEEQIIVERWLTSPKFSSDLVVISDNGEVVATYCGKFVNTEWHQVPGGFSGVTFTFENNGPYAKQHREFQYEFVIPEELDDDPLNPIEVEDEDATWEFDVVCDTDELEEYTYPTLRFLQTRNFAKPVMITNVTDNNNAMSIKCRKRLPIIMDCNHCILSDGTTSGLIRFSDVGWKDVGNIYWPRLLPGTNHFVVIGECRINIEFDIVDKKAGGWL